METSNEVLFLGERGAEGEGSEANMQVDAARLPARGPRDRLGGRASGGGQNPSRPAPRAAVAIAIGALQPQSNVSATTAGLCSMAAAYSPSATSIRGVREFLRVNSEPTCRLSPVACRLSPVVVDI